jgi:hypothetical protein
MGRKRHGAAQDRPLVLDAGALIALEKHNPFVRKLLSLAHRERTRILIPAGALAQAWRGPRQAALGALVNHSTTSVPPLDRALAKAVGLLCGAKGTSDVVDAQVALVAARERGVVVSSDPDDLERLDATLSIERLGKE